MSRYLIGINFSAFKEGRGFLGKFMPGKPSQICSLKLFILDGLVKSRTPLKNGVQVFCNSTEVLDSGWSLFPPRGAGAGMRKKGLLGLFSRASSLDETIKEILTEPGKSSKPYVERCYVQGSRLKTPKQRQPKVP
ncbi:MAG: hypothetical protein MUO52_19130, partial [Desulfobacterales bacterium]|nr:hypothetical protein [Desulfobacterales bacterium]